MRYQICPMESIIGMCARPACDATRIKLKLGYPSNNDFVECLVPL